MIQSPLNYTGGKYKLLPQILPLFPDRIDSFVDLFCGGCNVGINIAAKSHVYNDNCAPLMRLYELMIELGADEFTSRIEGIVKEYELSDVKSNGYGYYGCTSGEGLSKYNRERFLKLRKDINLRPIHDEEYYAGLFVLIVFAFNNQIRFNGKGEYNLPVGKRDFNGKMQAKLKSFISRLQEQAPILCCGEFDEIDLSHLGAGDFVYADPPYLITCATYNEQDSWSDESEIRLLKLLDRLNDMGIRFALSNVTESKGKRNELLLEWISRNKPYSAIELSYSYKNSNYHRQNRESTTKEVLVVNYRT